MKRSHKRLRYRKQPIVKSVYKAKKKYKPKKEIKKIKRPSELLKEHNGIKASDITDRKKIYAREQYHTFFYVFNNVKDYKAWEKHCKRVNSYAFYDGLRVYKQEDVDAICDLREQGKSNEIRY